MWLPGSPCARQRRRRQPQGSSRECPQRFVHPRHRRDGLVRQGVHPPRCWTPRPQRRRRLLPGRAEAVRGAASSSTTTPGCAGSSATSATEQRLNRAMHGVDYVIHAAALKQVDTAEYNPFEFVQDQRHRLAERHRGLHRRRREEGGRAVDGQGLQPDQPLRRDQAHRRQAVHHRQPLRRRRTRPASSVVRYGNVMGSRGSVIPFFRDAARAGPVAADHRPADDPLPHHAAAGRADSWSSPSS